MVTNKLKRFSSLLVGLSIAALSSPSFATHSWNGYHWARTDTTNPFVLPIGDNMTTQEWRNLLATTMVDWYNSGDTPIYPAYGSLTTNKRCSMVAGTTQVCNGNYGYNGWLGLATINIVNGTHITQGSAKMNDSYFNLSLYDNPNERLHVVCQEVAHTFGLDHQSTDGSSQNTCMDYFSNTGANATSTLSTVPNQHDFDELYLIYDHLDDSGSTTKTRPGKHKGTGIDITDDPQSWGRLVSQSANGRSSTYERSNPNGSKTVTHVYWTLEAASRCRSCDHRYEEH